MRLSDYIALQQGLPEAPVDGETYGRRGSDESWQVVLTEIASDARYLQEAPADGSTYGRRGSDQSWQVSLTLTESDARYLQDAPSDGEQYARQNGAWTIIANAGGTDLGNSRNSTSVTVTSSTGNDTTLPAATTSLAGVMTAGDKQALDAAQGLPSGNAGQALKSDGGTDWSATGVIRMGSNAVMINNPLGSFPSGYNFSVTGDALFNDNLFCDGAGTFIGIALEGTYPNINTNDTNAASNEKQWIMTFDSGSLVFAARNDSGVAGSRQFYFSRTSNNIDEFIGVNGAALNAPNNYTLLTHMTPTERGLFLDFLENEGILGPGRAAAITALTTAAETRAATLP